jgi:hypothetical protein
MNVVSGNITLYPQDWQVVDALAESLGLNRSSAIRMIIRKWLETASPELLETLKEEAHEQSRHGNDH